MDLKGLLADQMGLFTPYDILGALIGLCLAALLGLVLGRVVPLQGAQPRTLAVWAGLSALAVGLVRASVPLSIAFVGVALLLRREGQGTSERHFLLNLAAVLVGVGCGSSAGLITLVCFVPVVLLLRWALVSKST